MKISAVFVVRNEVHRIHEALEKVRPHVDEIVVVDQQSDDGTAELLFSDRIADRVIFDENLGFCEPSRERAVHASTGEWILVLDADEEITPHFAQAMRRIVFNQLPGCDGIDCWYLTRRSEIEGYGVVEAEHCRFYRRGRAWNPPEIHTEPTPNPFARTARLDGVSIISRKSAQEQTLDDERYRRIMGPAYGPQHVQPERLTDELLEVRP